MLHDTTLFGNLLSNDYDSDGDAISAHLVAEPSHGTVNLNPDGTFTYAPNAGYVGVDSFTIVWSDGVASSSEGTVFLEVLDNPLPDLQTILMQEGDAVEIGLASSLELANISYEAFGLPPDLVLDGQTGMLSGRVSYDAVPEDLHEMTYNVTLTATVDGLIYTRGFSIVVLARSPFEPIPEADVYVMNEQGQVMVTADQGLLSNDRADPTQLPLRVTEFQALNGGMWIVEESGALEFNSNATGELVFVGSYTVSTPSGFTASRAVFVWNSLLAVKPNHLKEVYNEFVKYVGNRVAAATAKFEVGKQISVVLNQEGEPVTSGRFGILNAPATVGALFSKRPLLGGLPKEIEDAKREYAKENNIPVEDVRIDLEVHFRYYPPPRRSADATLVPRLADRNGRAAPLRLPGMLMKNINVPNGPDAQEGYRDYGDLEAGEKQP